MYWLYVLAGMVLFLVGYWLMLILSTLSTIYTRHSINLLMAFVVSNR